MTWSIVTDRTLLDEVVVAEVVGYDEGAAVVHPGSEGGAPEGTAFRYRLLDTAGREVDVIEHRVPLHVHDTIIVDSAETWRVVSVLGCSATVARA
jgi:hypothetical protein